MPNRATPGQPLQIPARDWNGLIDMLRAEQNRHKGGAGEASSALTDNAGIVWVKNATGLTLDRFSVLGIDGPMFDPTAGAGQLITFKNDVLIKGVVPSNINHPGRFLVLRDPLAAGAIGRGYIDGICPARIDVANTQHKWADVKDGTCTSLLSDWGGTARILWQEPGTSLRWAIVRLGDGGTPVGQIEHQVWGMLTGNGAGWGLPLAVPDLTEVVT